MQTVASILEHLECFAPRSLAEEWDNVGLLLGDRNSPVEKILTCLTVTPESAEEAVEIGAQLIITHHPILFQSVQRLTTSTKEGKMLLSLIRSGVAVYSPHTAFDNTANGINDRLAEKLGLIDVKPLRAERTSGHCKVVVFTPEADLTAVSNAMFQAGAGEIGEYSQCSFRLLGTGTFYGSEATNPTVGQKGNREEVSEWRLEVVCPEQRLEAVLEAMRTTHSYEEPAFDIYPLRSQETSQTGSGRMGTLSEEATLRNLASALKEALGCGPIQLVGNPDERVSTVAIVCGAGGSMLSDAIRVRADVFLTGEMRFHDYLRAEAEGIALCLPGHYATERFALEELAMEIKSHFPGVECKASKKEHDPVIWV